MVDCVHDVVIYYAIVMNFLVLMEIRNRKLPVHEDDSNDAILALAICDSFSNFVVVYTER